MKYVTAEDIKHYMMQRTHNYQTDLDFVHMCNYFCQGAVTSVSNKIFNYLEDDAQMVYNTYNCKLDSGAWEIVDSDGKEILAFESFSDLVEKK